MSTNLSITSAKLPNVIASFISIVDPRMSAAMTNIWIGCAVDHRVQQLLLGEPLLPIGRGVRLDKSRVPGSITVPLRARRPAVVVGSLVRSSGGIQRLPSRVRRRGRERVSWHLAGHPPRPVRTGGRATIATRTPPRADPPHR